MQTFCSLVTLTRSKRALGAGRRGCRGASLADAAGQHRRLTGIRRGGGRPECGWIGADPECSPCRLWPALHRLLRPCDARTVYATTFGTDDCNDRPIVCAAFGFSPCRLHRTHGPCPTSAPLITHTHAHTRTHTHTYTYIHIHIHVTYAYVHTIDRSFTCSLWQASAASSV